MLLLPASILSAYGDNISVEARFGPHIFDALLKTESTWTRNGKAGGEMGTDSGGSAVVEAFR
jgi:hypothetical protein